MGSSISAYHFYGVHVPRDKYAFSYQTDETDRLDRVINSDQELRFSGIGHLTAGDYDRDHLFLFAGTEGSDASAEVPLGEFRVVRSLTCAVDIPYWYAMLKRLAEQAGYEGLDEPGWITVPDRS